MYAEFGVYAEHLNPQHITDLLGMRPDKTWRKGDLKAARGVATRKEGCWKIATVPSENTTQSLNDHLRALLGRIGAARESVTLLAKDSLIEFACVIKFEADVPALHIDADVLQAIAAMNGCVDLDVYL